MDRMQTCVSCLAARRQSLAGLVAMLLLLGPGLVLPTAAQERSELSLGASNRSDGPMGLEEAIQTAVTNSPRLRAAQSTVQAAEERIRPAGALADPEVEISVSDLGMDAGGQKAELMVRQMVDWPGKRPLMREEMRAMAGMSAQEAAELKLEIAARVREAYWDLHLVQQNLELTEKTLQILSDFAGIAQTRYTLGAGLQQDVLRAQAEVHKLEARRAQYRQEARVRLAALNVLLGRPAQGPLELVMDEPMTPELQSSAAELAEEALARRPLLRAMELQIHRQDVRTSLARKESLPNLELLAGVMRTGPSEVPVPGAMQSAAEDAATSEMPGETSFSMGVMVSVPLWKSSKQDRKVAEARHEREAASARAEQARLEVGLEVQTLRDEAGRLREQIRVYDNEVLPRDRQAVRAALESYQVGQADFLTLLSSQIAALEDQTELHRLHSLYNKTLSRLDRAVGRSGTAGEAGRVARADASDTSGPHATLSQKGNEDVR